MTRTKRTTLLFSGAIGVASALCIANGAASSYRLKLHSASTSAAASSSAHQAVQATTHASRVTAASITDALAFSRLACLPPLSVEVLEALKSQPVSQTKGRLQIGVGRNLDQAIVVNSTTVPASQWTTLPSGAHSLSVTLTSSGALGLRVNLESLRLPGSAQITVSDPSNPGSSPPPITAQSLAGQTQVWAPTVFSDTVAVQCEVPPGSDLAAVSFTIAEVSHIYTLLTNFGTTKGEAQSCENDVSCYAAYAQSASGVALMDYVNGGNTYTCTGCLLASTDPSAVANYFLTAQHCVGDQSTASTIELFWFYQTSTCNGTPPSLSSVPSTSGGATLLASSSANDFTFMRLGQVAPSGATPLPWSLNPPGSNETLTIIHHPAGDYKRISFGTYFGSDADFWAVQWNSGVTEGGSSGGPLLNGNQQVIGQLNGGFEGPGSSCSDPTAPDQFGRFDVTYPAIAQWIDPSGSGGNTNDTNDVSVTPVQGTYNGLFFDGGNGVSQQSSGSFSLTSSSSGRFSGRMQIGSAIHTFTGRFDTTGAATVTANKRSGLTMQFQLNAQNVDEISGVVSDGSFTAQLSGERAVYSARNPAPQAGRYTVMIAGTSGSTAAPAGTGYGTVVVSPAGKITMSGSLADGTKFSESSTVSTSGQWPFYVSLYGGQGSLFSWITFGSNGTSDFNGALNWIKPGVRSARAYPSGFTVATTISGSLFNKVKSGTPILSLSNATLTLTSADGTTINISDPIMINPNNRVSNLSSNRLSVIFSGATGTFTGRVQNPGTSQMISFSGVAFQDQNTANGYFIYQDQSGQVTIGP